VSRKVWALFVGLLKLVAQSRGLRVTSDSSSIDLPVNRTPVRAGADINRLLKRWLLESSGSNPLSELRPHGTSGCLTKKDRHVLLLSLNCFSLQLHLKTERKLDYSLGKRSRTL
jgi:hypothetical protein